MVVKLNPLSIQEVTEVLKNAIINKEGLASFNVKVEDETLLKIAEISNGDVRTALNGLEIAVLTTNPSEDRIHTYNKRNSSG